MNKMIKTLKELKNYIYSAIGKFGLGLSVLILNTTIANSCSKEEYGIFVTLNSIMILVSILAGLGVYQLLVREFSIVDNDYSNRVVFVKCVIQCIIVAIVATMLIEKTLIITHEAWTRNHIYEPGKFSLYLWSMGLVVQSVCFSYLQAKRKIGLAIWQRGLLANILIVLVFYVVISNDKNINVIVWIIGIAHFLVAGITALAIFFSFKKGVRENKNNDNYLDLLKESLPLYFNSILYYFINSFDVIILGHFYSQSDVAIYGAGIRIVVFVAASYAIITLVYEPTCAKLFYEKEIIKLEQFTRKLSTLSILVSIPVYLVLIIEGDYIIRMLYGEKYAESYYVLLIIGAAHLINVFVGQAGSILLMTGKQKTMMIISVFTCIMTVFLLIMLTKLLGIIGTSLAIAIGIIFQNVLMMFAVYNILNIKSWSYTSLIGFKKCLQ